jgi:hypothetical protein
LCNSIAVGRVRVLCNPNDASEPDDNTPTSNVAAAVCWLLSPLKKKIAKPLAGWLCGEKLMASPAHTAKSGLLVFSDPHFFMVV